MNVAKLASGASSMFVGSNSDDEFADRLNYRYTVGLLVFFTFILSTKQYTSEVIKCWVPAHLIIYQDYVGEICWVQNTYYVPLNQTIPKDEIEREKNEIKYYQWVNFVLLLQGLLFYMPRVFWTSFSGKGGLYLSDLVEAARNYKNGDKFYKKGSYMEYLVLNIDQFVDDQRRWDTERSRYRAVRILGTCIPCFGRYLGNYIIVLYIMSKLMYIVITFLQIYIIGTFLGQSFWLFGYNYLKNLVKGGGFLVINSKYFPRVTLCDFMIREVGNPQKAHRYTVECVLPVNLFNQQIFTIIWFWYIIVLICNIIGLLLWINRLMPFRSKSWIMMRTNLFNNNVSQKLVTKRLNHFLQFYLEPDGIFMIRMIGNNTSDYVATDLIRNLWCQHDEKYGHLFPDEPHNGRKPCTFEHGHMEKVRKMYSTGGDSYQFPHQESRILIAPKSIINIDKTSRVKTHTREKSNNYCYPEQSYAEARRTLYLKKHNINNFNDLAEAKSRRSSQNQHDSDSDEYYQLIRRRIGLALLETSSHKRSDQSGGKRPVVYPTINDETTNSDDSDSREEQAFHQHHNREKRIKSNERIRQELEIESQMVAATAINRKESTGLLSKKRVDTKDGQPSHKEMDL